MEHASVSGEKGRVNVRVGGQERHRLIPNCLWTCSKGREGQLGRTHEIK